MWTRGQRLKQLAAFVNKDESLTVKHDALPVNAELHIRDVSERGRRGE